MKQLPVLSASLATDAVAACADIFHVVVVPVINAAPLLVSRYELLQEPIFFMYLFFTIS